MTTGMFTRHLGSGVPAPGGIRQFWRAGINQYPLIAMNVATRPAQAEIEGSFAGDYASGGSPSRKRTSSINHRPEGEQDC